MSHAHAYSDKHKLSLALTITLLFAVVEAIGGWWSGSLALLGDAGHMFTDALALAIAALAARLAMKPASHRHSYGLGRAEVIAALFNSLFMLAVVAAIVSAAIGRLQQPQPVAGPAVMAVAFVGLIVNLIVARILSHGHSSLNTRGALLHVLGDLLGSVAALLAGAVIWLTGWTPIDPLLSLLICVLILASAVHLLREVLHVIMEGVPQHLDLPAIGRDMAAVADTLSVHDLHIWTLSSGNIALSAHVVISDLQAWPEILHRLRERLHSRYDIDHVTLQPEIAPPKLHILKEPGAATDNQ